MNITYIKVHLVALHEFHFKHVLTIRFVMSVRSPKGITRSPLDGFSLNLIPRDFSKICRENWTFIKICEWRVLYMKTCVHLWYPAEFFLEWEMFQTNVVEKTKTHILCSITFSRKSCRLWDDVGKYGRDGQTTDDTAQSLCVLHT